MATDRDIVMVDPAPEDTARRRREISIRYNNDRIFRFAINQVAMRAADEALKVVGIGPQEDRRVSLAVDAAQRAILDWIGIAGETRA